MATVGGPSGPTATPPRPPEPPEWTDDGDAVTTPRGEVAALQVVKFATVRLILNSPFCIQDTQYLQAQISGGITVDNRPGQSSALMQQLDHLRWTNDKLFRETLGDSWCGNQVRLTNTTHSHRPYTGSKITGQLHKNHKNTSEVIIFIKSSIYEVSFSHSLRCGVSRCLR